MTKEYEHSKGSLNSNQHAEIDVDEYYADIDHMMPRNGVVLDIGGGAGRDAVRAKRVMKGLPYVINTDPDPARAADATALYGDMIEIADTAAKFDDIARRGKIPHIVCGIDTLSEFNRVAKGVEGNFVLCNAVFMFIPLEKHQDSLSNLFKVTATAGHCAVRYRTENLKDGMVEIDHATFDDQCRKAGFEVNRTEPLADPAGRDHVWHQIILKKPYPRYR